MARDVAVPWDSAYCIGFLKPKLGEHHAEFLTALVAALNHGAQLPTLYSFTEWGNEAPVPLDVEWPD